MEQRTKQQIIEEVKADAWLPSYDDWFKAMDIYAKQVAEQVLKDAAENVSIPIHFANMRIRVQEVIKETPIQLP